MKNQIRSFIDAVINGEKDRATTLSSDIVREKSRSLVQGEAYMEASDPKSAPGAKDVKATLKAAGEKEIKTSGEANPDPKSAPGAKDVKATKKAAGEKEIKTSGEAKPDPKAAPGAKDVKATLKAAGDGEIKK